MLQKVKDYTTWGEVDSDSLELILKKRACLKRNKHLTEEWLKNNTKYSSFKELAEALHNGNIKYNELGIKPVLRLNPPRKGYSGIKRAYKVGGALGYRSKDINELIARMV
jgi:large subunit ribosomal protein L30